MNESSPRQPIDLDARGLRALAHPQRLRILDLLEADGPATATSLADRLGVKTGVTSWHLLKLAEHGLVEEIVDRGNKRERWWKPTESGWGINHGEFSGDEALAEASARLLSTVLAQQLSRALQFLNEDWSQEWRRAWLLTTDQTLTLDPEAMEALRAELWAVLDRYRAAPSAGDAAERVVIQLQGFPRARSQS